MSELAEWLQDRCCPGSLPRDGHWWVQRGTDTVLFFPDSSGRPASWPPGPEIVMRPVPRGSRSTLERELQLEELGAQRTTLPPLAEDSEEEQRQRSSTRHLQERQRRPRGAGQRVLTWCWLCGHPGTTAGISPTRVCAPRRSPRGKSRGPVRRHCPGNAVLVPSPAPLSLPQALEASP